MNAEPEAPETAGQGGNANAEAASNEEQVQPQPDSAEDRRDGEDAAPATAAEGASEGEGASAEGDAPAEEGASEDAADGGDAEAASADSASSKLKWYAVHTYSGHENKARLALLERIRNSTLAEQFGEVLIPTESVVEMVKGQRRTTTRKFYPSYMFIQMDMNELTFHLVKNTPKVTGFLGGNKPVPVKDHEIAGINRQMTEGVSKPKPKISFDEGETVRVTTGPFSNFTGIVEVVRPEKQKVRVLVSIFGRATPIELDFVEVEKA